MSTDDDVIHPFGIHASTGRPLGGLTDEVIEGLLEGDRAQPQDTGPVRLALDARGESGSRAFALANEGDSDPNDLTQAGWGVLFAPGLDPKVLDLVVAGVDRQRGGATEGLHRIGVVGRGAAGRARPESGAGGEPDGQCRDDDRDHDRNDQPRIAATGGLRSP